ncbi:tetraacyldisaccharide 4'-kinase [Oricola cellulosilytica]|uniref:Tetraacyldisaccharide 4'-kinase n=1 Tax=Oricola cellulosilytica TaxID=1429082 RepID=A0A4R0PI22_9HYPH|nr:tetraacyldisaccharide 4'-kinase [Oricola cellulosilytica]TCD16648.1 tetraacyldisaccharide 4'-kinase [Oricola cellulosilytica]
MAGHEAPPFWYHPTGWQARALAPLSWVYGSIARMRMDRARPRSVAAPVLCIGNLTVGGSGKTPTAIALAKAARKGGFTPGFLARGYGGTHQKPHRVDADQDSAKAVGDEPLLLARTAPTVIARNRGAGARQLVDCGVNFIVMDDGFQSRTVHIDYSVITIDARRGVGNGAVIPAGPLRAPLVDQMRHANAVLRIGDGDAGDGIVRAAARAAKPSYRARLAPRGHDSLSRKRVLAFAGIGDPGKFYDTLTQAGCWISAKRDFPDHHVYTARDARDLLDQAAAQGLLLVTTEKDAVRLNHAEGALGELGRKIRTVSVDLEFEDPSVPRALVEATVRNYDERRLHRR